MPWLIDALSEVRLRGNEIKDRVQQHARSLAAGKNDRMAGSFLQGACTAKDVEDRLETEARKISRLAPAAETIQQWLVLNRDLPQVRYPDNTLPAISSFCAAPSSSTKVINVVQPELTFTQILLRSRALEITTDLALHTPELRASLRDHALTSQVWPRDETPSQAFAHAFTSLLEVTIGPPETYLPILGALLSTDNVIDEQCHCWLLTLLLGLRRYWENAAFEEREHEIDVLEVAARDGLSRLDQMETSADSPGNLNTLLQNLTRRSRMSGTAYCSWRLRSAFAADFENATKQMLDESEARLVKASEVASAVSSRIKDLEHDTARLSISFEELKRDLLSKGQVVRNKIESVQPVKESIQREIEEAETTRRELLQQALQLAAKVESLKRRHEEIARNEDALRADHVRIEDTLTAKLSSHEAACRHAATVRALTSTVGDLAAGFISPGNLKGHFQEQRDRGSKLLGDAERSRNLAGLAALSLAEKEVDRLVHLSRTVDVCATVIEERAKSREAMEKLGVPLTTLESDVAGEADIAQALTITLTETDCCREELETLCLTLEGGNQNLSGITTCSDSVRITGDDSLEATQIRGHELAATLRERLAEADSRRPRLQALVPAVPCVDVNTVSSEGSRSRARGSKRSSNTQSAASGSNGGILDAVRNTLAAVKASESTNIAGVLVSETDPFLLMDTEASSIHGAPEVAATTSARTEVGEVTGSDGTDSWEVLSEVVHG